VQIFKEYQLDNFQGLPPMFTDSLMDTLVISYFKNGLQQEVLKKYTSLEQLTYGSNESKGALEYRPIKELPKTSEMNINEVIIILGKTLKLMAGTTGEDALLASNK